MLRGSTPAKWQQWSERLERFAKSGQTVSEFCRAEGISAASFYQWKRRLASVGSTAPRLGKRGPRNKAPAFKQLHVSSSDVSSGVTVRLPNGIVLELGSDTSMLERILAQVLDHQQGTSSC